MSDPAVADPGGRRDAAPGEERLRERCLANSLWAKFYLGWELIGRGGYGTVIGTRHRTFGEIAIKSFEWLSAQEEARFDQEAAALARLNHPSIVRIYGAFKDDGLYWFEMERVHGPTLKEALETRQKDGRPFATSEVLDIEINGDRTPVAFMEAHTKQVPLPIGFLNRDLSQELQDVITLGLAKDPRRRPSWDEILATLRQEQAGLRLVSERETASRRDRRAV